ncbi:MAG: tyrosine-type recombinase/integrase, partial [Planctomycetota bacterium]
MEAEDDRGRVVDFHALRHTFISNLARAGVHPRNAQALARHSTIDLTMNVYTHVAMD